MDAEVSNTFLHLRIVATLLVCAIGLSSATAAAATLDSSASTQTKSATGNVADAMRPEVDQLLKSAAEAISQGHLVEPANSNAVAYYASVLDRDPHNAIALEGLRELLPMAAEAIANMIDRGDLAGGVRSIDCFAKVDPNNYTLATLRGRVRWRWLQLRGRRT